MPTVTHLQQDNSLIALWSVLKTLMLSGRNIFFSVWFGARQRIEWKAIQWERQLNNKT